MSSNSVLTDSEAHPDTCSIRTTPLSPEVKKSGREADNSPASTTEVKNGWKYISIPPYAVMTCAQTNLRYFSIVTLHN